MKKYSLLLMGIIALVSGCSSTSTVAPQATPTIQIDTKSDASTTGKTISLTDVAKHSTANDCWIVIKSKVYDITSSIAGHPGGEAILKGCGKDSTAMFSQHSSTAQTMLANYFIGDLQ